MFRTAMVRTALLWTLLGSFLLVVLAPPASLAQGGPIPQPGPMPPMAGHVIVVTGRGSVEATPDEATVALGVQSVRPTAREAQDQSSAVMDQIVRQIVALGIPREKIHTTTIALYAQRKPGSDSEEITGYAATNRVTVTVDELRLVGRAIDASVAAGANTLDSLTFGVRDQSAYRAQAFKIAVQDAQATASAIASAAGISLFHLARIEEAGAMIGPRPLGVQAAAVSTPVMPGTVPVEVQVRAVYEF